MSSSVSGSRSSSLTQTPYPFYQDAVRVFVQQVGVDISPTGEDPMTSSTSSIEGSNCNSSRRFSVDPQLTTFDIMRNLIGRAFDMKGDFAISYRAFDDFGGETYLPLVSDWDLSAAFLSASNPDLQLVIEPKNIPLDVDLDYEAEEPWDLVCSTEVINESSQSQPKPNLHQVIGTGNQGRHVQNSVIMPQRGSQHESSNCAQIGSPLPAGSSKVLTAMTQWGGAQYPLSLNSKINTAGIFNTMEKWVQKAKTFVEDLSVVTQRPPLSDVEFRNYLDPGGVLCRPRELRYACYHGGIEPGLRKVVWKHLLNIYPDGLSGNARMDYVRNKSKDYYELRDAWKVQDGTANDDIKCVSNMVRKDVLRTDRHLQFFAGDENNQNIGFLFNILTTYALNHPSVGYCQGMSDLASPLLATMGDEAQAYVCFCALMDRLKPNFSTDGLAMSLKFTHLSEALAYYDAPFWGYLKSIGADDLLFCYRWLLLEMKREFAFEDALRMMEVMWASLPYKPQDVPLYEIKFNLSTTHSIPIPVPNLTASYSRVCAIRRSSTSVCPSEHLRGRRLSRKPKANPLSLDENSLTSMSSIATVASGRSHTKPFYSLDETTEILSSSEFANSPFEHLSLPHSPSGTPTPKPRRMIKNLREFWTMGKSSSKEDQSPDSTPFSSKSSTISNFDSVFQQMHQGEIINGQVFYDEGELSPLTLSTQSLPGQRSRHSSANSLGTGKTGKVSQHHSHTPARPLGSASTSTSMSALTRNSSVSLNTAASLMENMNLNLKSEKADGPQDLEQRLQVSADSEVDSGHCYGDSEFENSLQEPEFSRDRKESVGRKVKIKMPSPDTLGGGNPFLMFLCLTLLLQHRDHIVRNAMDYNETAMYFDKMIRKHNVARVLAHARMMYSEYLKQNCTRA